MVHLVINRNEVEMKIFLITQGVYRFIAVLARSIGEAAGLYEAWAVFHDLPPERTLTFQQVEPAELPGQQGHLEELLTWDEPGVLHMVPDGSWSIVTTKSR